jgi:hypothetical protein
MRACSLLFFARADLASQADQFRMDVAAPGIVRPATPIILGEDVWTKQDSREQGQQLAVKGDLNQ